MSGCSVCKVRREGMLTLQSGAMVCRPCGQRVARLLWNARPELLHRLWLRDDERTTLPGEQHVSTPFPDDDIKPHWDLGVAYADKSLATGRQTGFRTL